MNDLLLRTRDVETHAKLLDRLLKTLRGNTMYPPIPKGNFGLDGIEHLGYRVGSEGTTPRREKVTAIQVWLEELIGAQAKQLLGSINYWRLFKAPAFADLATSLIEVTKKDVDFKWTSQHNASCDDA